MIYLLQMPCHCVDARDIFSEFLENNGISRAFLISGDVLMKRNGQKIARTGNQLTRPGSRMVHLARANTFSSFNRCCAQATQARTCSRVRR